MQMLQLQHKISSRHVFGAQRKISFFCVWSRDDGLGPLEMQALGGAQIVRENDCSLEFDAEYLFHEGTLLTVHIQGHEDRSNLNNHHPTPVLLLVIP